MKEVVDAFRSYWIQKHKVYKEPFAGLGKRVDIIHISMLYWPEQVTYKGLPQRGGERVTSTSGEELLPPVRASERPHGEERLMSHGVRVSAI